MSPGAKRDSYSEVALQSWLSSAIDRCNPKVPAAARGDALQKGLRVEAPTVIQANQLFRHMLVAGVDVERPRWDGDHRGRSRPAIAAGGGGVSTRVPTVWRRHPGHHIHHRSGADPEDPDTPRRTAQFTPGSRSTRRDLPTAPCSSREYTPALSAERHRPEAHCRRLSILSPAVTATGTTFCAA